MTGKKIGPIDGGLPPRRSMTSLKQWLSLRGYGLVTSMLFGATTSPQKMRARFERFGSVSRDTLQGKFPNVEFDDQRVGALGIEVVRAVESPKRVVFHLHGGAFFMGSPASYRTRTIRLSYRLDAEVYVPDYRLAPEHPYPAALDDAYAAFRHVRALRPHAPIFITGDSAGGGLGLSLLIRLRERGLAMPDGAILLSPWTDMTTSGDSVEANHGRELWFSRNHLEVWADYYVGQADAHSAYLSPVFADLSELSPLLLFAGEDELLLDDARRVHESASREGTESRMLVGEGMQHDWPLALPWLDESKRAWGEMRQFVEAYPR